LAILNEFQGPAPPRKDGPGSGSKIFQPTSSQEAVLGRSTGGAPRRMEEAVARQKFAMRNISHRTREERCLLRTLQRGELRGPGFIDFVSRSNYRLQILGRFAWPGF
jgi:hypothetical protein